MTGWNSQQGGRKYAIQFETDDRDLYKLVEKACQLAMDQVELRKLRKKETPTECTHEATLYRALTCPSCKNVVSRFETWGETNVRILPHYCQFCGQRIAFPKEET